MGKAVYCRSQQIQRHLEVFVVHNLLNFPQIWLFIDILTGAFSCTEGSIIEQNTCAVCD